MIENLKRNVHYIGHFSLINFLFDDPVYKLFRFRDHFSKVFEVMNLHKIYSLLTQSLLKAP